jgi:hypothetical protein
VEIDAILRCFADVAGRMAAARPTAAGEGGLATADATDQPAGPPERRLGVAPEPGPDTPAAGLPSPEPGAAPRPGRLPPPRPDRLPAPRPDRLPAPRPEQRPGAPGPAPAGTQAPPGPPPAPFARLPATVVDICRGRVPPAWLGTGLPLPLDPEAPQPQTLPRTPEVRRLARADALRPAEPALRLGWVVVSGRVPVGDHTVDACFPLVSQRVVVDRDLARSPNLTLRPVGDVELTPLVADDGRATSLEEHAQFGSGRLERGGDDLTTRDIARLPRLQSWVRDVVAATGLPPVAEMLAPTADPVGQRARPRLAAWVGAVLYLAEDAVPVDRQASLGAWAGTRGIGATALAAVYGLGPAPTAAPGHEPIETPFTLSVAQRAVVARARREPLTVATGPPGSGKTTVAAAVASDAVSRGASVLLVTGSAAAADRLAATLAAQPAPQPLRLGRSAHSRVVARAAGPGASNGEVRAAEHRLAEARARQSMLERTVANRLEREETARAAARWDTVVEHLDAIAPRALHGADPGRLASLLRRAQGTDDAGRWRRFRARWAEARLRTIVRASADTPLSEVALAVRAAQDRRVAHDLRMAGGTVLVRVWAELAAADDEVRRAAGALAAVRADSEVRHRKGRGVAEVDGLLSARRHRRRQLLARVDQSALLSVVPLWLGTVDEVDGVLPLVPGLFDLVVVDDASDVDQVSAAGALLRARRAVVVGDPRQKRRTCPISDDDLHRALDDHGLGGQAGRLDVRRASLLDVASGATPAEWLDEHYRSGPHLVAFPSQRFYDGRVAVTTRQPANDAEVAVDVTYVTVVPGIGDPVEREVAAAVERVEHLAVLEESDIAVTSPFPEVAERLAAALAERFDLDDVARLGLRVGPVEAFRATAADHVVLVLGLATDSPPARRRTVEEPDLFNLMVTRARRRLLVVTALDPPSVSRPAGLVDAFLAHARRPLGPPPEPAAPGEWVAALADEVRANGLATQVGYQVGRWTVDLCAGKDGEAVAIETGVHPDGVEAHIERHRALVRTGWRVVDGYPSRWEGDAARAAADIVESLRP